MVKKTRREKRVEEAMKRSRNWSSRGHLSNRLIQVLRAHHFLVPLLSNPGRGRLG
jgi:hypothetical protein